MGPIFVWLICPIRSQDSILTIATLDQEERPILSQRDQRMGRRLVLYSSESQPASQPTSQPDNQSWIKLISQQPLNGSSSSFKLKLSRPNQNLKLVIIKMTSNGRWPQNINFGISQQPMIGSSSNFKLKLRGPSKIRKCSEWKWSSMEDDLKILKVEFLSNHWSDLTLI